MTSEWTDGDITTADGVRLHYYRRGSGPSLVLAHGATDNGMCWRRVADALADDFDVVAYDAPSHGRSDDGQPGSGADVVAVVEALGLAPTLADGSLHGSRRRLRSHRRAAGPVPRRGARGSGLDGRSTPGRDPRARAAGDRSARDGRRVAAPRPSRVGNRRIRSISRTGRSRRRSSARRRTGASAVSPECRGRTASGSLPAPSCWCGARAGSSARRRRRKRAGSTPGYRTCSSTPVTTSGARRTTTSSPPCARSSSTLRRRRPSGLRRRTRRRFRSGRRSSRPGCRTRTPRTVRSPRPTRRGPAR